MDIEKKINQETNDKFDFKIKSAVLEKEHGLCRLEFFYRDGVILSAAERAEVENCLTGLLPEGFSYEYKFVKNFLTSEQVKARAESFVRSNFPSVCLKIGSVDCEGEQKSVEIIAPLEAKEYVQAKHVEAQLAAFLRASFDREIAVRCTLEESPKEFLEADDLEPVFEQTAERYIDVTDVVPVVGDLLDTTAFYIKDKAASGEEVCFAGTIGFIKEYEYTPKKAKEGKQQKDNKEDTEEKPGGRKYFKFSLIDPSDTMQCIFFASSQNLEAMQKLAKGDEILVSGLLQNSKYDDALSLKVSRISRCKLPEVKEEEIVFKDVPERYRFCFPEKVEYYSQVDLFGQGEQKVNPLFLEHDVVVFDFETTGIRVDGSDKIIEIGAVKLVKGKIAEQFSCLVDPEMHIPEGASKTNGIFDDDVKGKPRYQDVLPDFYKFTHGCILSGYNIDGFDMLFLINFGKKCGYNFDNPTIDAYKLALSQVRGAKNYKLGTIAEKLGVALDHAHRAIYDTIATAEVLLKITEGMDKIEI